MKFSSFITVIIAACLLFSRCSSSPGSLVNSVNDVKAGNISRLPFAKNEFWVRGKVTHSAYIFGRGVISLSDETEPTNWIAVSTANNYAVGSTVTLRLERQPIISVDDTTFDFFVEADQKN